MVTVASLWLPILVSAAVVFVVSAMVWMVMPHHKKDFAPVENEDELMDAVRKSASRVGMYYFPFPTSGEQNPEYKKRADKGPVGILRVRDPKTVLNMGPALVQSFVLYTVISIFAAYMASDLGAGAEYMSVFGTAGVTAFMAYGFVGWQESIWFGLPKSVALKHTIDGFVYALLTAGIFGWLWP